MIYFFSYFLYSPQNCKLHDDLDLAFFTLPLVPTKLPCPAILGWDTLPRFPEVVSILCQLAWPYIQMVHFDYTDTYLSGNILSKCIHIYVWKNSIKKTFEGDKVKPFLYLCWSIYLYMGEEIYYRLNVCVTPKFVCWNLFPSMMGFGTGVFFQERWLGHEGRTLKIGFGALIRDPRRHHHLFYRVMTQQEDGSYQTPDLLAPWSGPCNVQNYEKLISVNYKPPSLWLFVIAAQTD